ncbi:sensor histidine kinase [Anaerosporobacter sp.]|uniref:sensor histidine kinase n=1 Tax=Anaerosporobacter sp. TaxID=1872529 RepID=UPI00286F0488|nr:histidine kinase [Anaerosporobacter sp.]
MQYTIEMLHYAAFGMLVLLLIATLLTGNLKKKVYFWFFITIILSFTGIIFEVFIEMMAGYTGIVIDILIRLMSFFSYSIVALQIGAFSLYLYEYLSIKTIVSKKQFYFFLFSCAGIIVLSGVASINEWYMQFDANNNYLKGEYYWITYILPTICMLIYMGIIINYRKALKVKEIFSLLTYGIIPIVCYMIEILHPDIYIAYVGCVFALFLIYLSIQIELMHQLEIQEAELIETRIAVMLSQIQPHFLYNSLNAIGRLCVDNPKAKKAIITFAEYLRVNMDSLNQKNPIPFEKELEHTKQYLWLEELRFEERLKVEFDIQVQEFMLPVLTLQPIVENAVRHGITKKKSGGTVIIRTEETKESILITVADDGIGFDQEEKKTDGRSHMGISNVNERLAVTCNGRLVIQSTPGNGTIAMIEIPKGRPERYSDLSFCSAIENLDDVF